MEACDATFLVAFYGLQGMYSGATSVLNTDQTALLLYTNVTKHFFFAKVIPDYFQMPLCLGHAEV